MGNYAPMRFALSEVLKLTALAYVGKMCGQGQAGRIYALALRLFVAFADVIPQSLQMAFLVRSRLVDACCIEPSLDGLGVVHVMPRRLPSLVLHPYPQRKHKRRDKVSRAFHRVVPLSFHCRC